MLDNSLISKEPKNTFVFASAEVSVGSALLSAKHTTAFMAMYFFELAAGLYWLTYAWTIKYWRLIAGLLLNTLELPQALP
jgi:hypothetical protein